ncbi:MAG TPA: VIT domain-containing protein, partial [Promineifilum sp.]
MKKTTAIAALFIALLAGLSAASARAQDQPPPQITTEPIVPPPIDEPPICIDCPVPPPIWNMEGLEIPYQRVDVTIADQVATTHVEQVFRNPNDWVLEGTYFFP